jgi:hypothetical protein
MAGSTSPRKARHELIHLTHTRRSAAGVDVLGDECGVLDLLSLRLERQLIVSALRMITQLFLVGLVLKTIFTVSSLWLTLLAAAVMVTRRVKAFGTRMQGCPPRTCSVHFCAKLASATLRCYGTWPAMGQAG